MGMNVTDNPIPADMFMTADRVRNFLVSFEDFSQPLRAGESVEVVRGIRPWKCRDKRQRVHDGDNSIDALINGVDIKVEPLCKLLAYRRIAQPRVGTCAASAGVPARRPKRHALVPPYLVAALPTVLNGRNAYLADGVQQVLGREPHDLTDYARGTAATGTWESQR